MRESLSLLRSQILVSAVVMLLVGCASKGPAPVENRVASRPGSSAATAPQVARPGYYLVKKGDTLYSIAHQYDRDYRELAAWNSLDDPNVIGVGQELRVVPPSVDAAAGGTGGTIIVGAPLAPKIESTPQSGSSGASPSSSPAVVPAASETVAGVPAVAGSAPMDQKTEPKGGRLAYSEKAWKDLQTRDKPTSQSGPVAKPTTSSPASEGKVGDDGIQWAWPGNGKVLAAFNESSNKGVDIAGNIGDPVLAASGGQVVYVGSGLRGYGNLVIIKHSNNFLSAYAHNHEILVKEKQVVQKGQKIATLGKSDADQPELHFEIRRMGKPVDPMKYLPSR
jgi:lipoprotein NlpD